MRWFTCQICFLAHFKKKALIGFAADAAANPMYPSNVAKEYSDPLFGRPNPGKEASVKELLRSPVCVFSLPGSGDDGKGFPAYSQVYAHLQAAVAAYNLLDTGLQFAMSGPDPDCWRIVYENGICKVVYNSDLTPSGDELPTSLSGTYQVGIHMVEPFA